MESLEVYWHGHAWLQPKIKMKILTTLSAPWYLAFPTSLLLFASPAMHLLLHSSSDRFFTQVSFLPTLEFQELAVLVIGLTSSVLTHRGHPPHWFLADFMQRWAAFFLAPLAPPSPALKKHPCRKGFVSYRTLDKTLALCHRFWLQRCPRLGRSLRCT